MLAGIVAILIISVILYVIFGVAALVIMGIILALFIVVIIAATKDGDKNSLKPLQPQLVEDTIKAHPELGTYKQFYGGQGILLILSENGYVAFFQGENFTLKSIDEVNSIKFIAQPFERNIKKVIDMAGTIHYRLEVADFSNPIIDLPFGVYKDNADKLRQTTEFAEIKSTFSFIKKNAKNKISPLS